MGKRSEFSRRDQDASKTPLAACLSLLKLLPPKTRFVEPCCGEGDLIEQLCAAALLDASVEVKVELDKLAAVDRRKRNGNGGGRAAG